MFVSVFFIVFITFRCSNSIIKSQCSPVFITWTYIKLLEISLYTYKKLPMTMLISWKEETRALKFIVQWNCEQEVNKLKWIITYIDLRLISSRTGNLCSYFVQSAWKNIEKFSIKTLVGMWNLIFANFHKSIFMKYMLLLQNNSVNISWTYWNSAKL